MTDQELLERAAKAAGVEVTGIVAEGIPHRFGGGYWNPITDDGDALRLATKLLINLYHGSQWVEAIFDHRKESMAVIIEYFRAEEHRALAMRRVIVRAAAELVKAAAQGDR
jgi:hypothetical protein